MPERRTKGEIRWLLRLTAFQTTLHVSITWNSEVAEVVGASANGETQTPTQGGLQRGKASVQHISQVPKGRRGFRCVSRTKIELNLKVIDSTLARDFFLLVALCIGLACALICLARPVMASMFESITYLV